MWRRWKNLTFIFQWRKQVKLAHLLLCLGNILHPSSRCVYYLMLKNNLLTQYNVQKQVSHFQVDSDVCKLLSFCSDIPINQTPLHRLNNVCFEAGLSVCSTWYDILKGIFNTKSTYLYPHVALKNIKLQNQKFSKMYWLSFFHIQL